MALSVTLLVKGEREREAFVSIFQPEIMQPCICNGPNGGGCGLLFSPSAVLCALSRVISTPQYEVRNSPCGTSPVFPLGSSRLILGRRNIERNIERGNVQTLTRI